MALAGLRATRTAARSAATRLLSTAGEADDSTATEELEQLENALRTRADRLDGHEQAYLDRLARENDEMDAEALDALLLPEAERRQEYADRLEEEARRLAAIRKRRMSPPPSPAEASHSCLLYTSPSPRDA